MLQWIMLCYAIVRLHFVCSSYSILLYHVYEKWRCACIAWYAFIQCLDHVPSNVSLRCNQLNKWFWICIYIKLVFYGLFNTCTAEDTYQNKIFISRSTCTVKTTRSNDHPFGGLNMIQSNDQICWWLCLVPTSTTRFASAVGYRMTKNWIGLYRVIQGNFFMNN